MNIPKKADVCFIKRMQHRAKELGEYGMAPEERHLTVFTDEHLKLRRKLDVIVSVTATPDGIAVRLVDPIETEILLEYESVGRVGSVRYGFDLDIDSDTEEFLGVLTEPVGAPVSIEESLSATA